MLLDLLQGLNGSAIRLCPTASSLIVYPGHPVDLVDCFFSLRDNRVSDFRSAGDSIYIVPSIGIYDAGVNCGGLVCAFNVALVREVKRRPEVGLKSSDQQRR